jgi:geranylgeranyl diphosphate synthase, type II
MNELPKKFAELAGQVENSLEGFLPGGETMAAGVVEAMRYSLTGGGKRIRPVLTMLSAELTGSSAESVLKAAAAIEMIHSCSLILDDLPSMDNATVRRGKPVLHMHAGEATAVLAAYGLLMRAFELLGEEMESHKLASLAASSVLRDAANCVGVGGMIGGQWRDLNPGSKDFEVLEYIHSHKTGSLFILSATLGARLAGAKDSQVECLASYAKNLGLAFQIVDDVMGHELPAGQLGKDGADGPGKVTFVSTIGVESSRAVAEDLVHTAKLSLESFGKQAGDLHSLADYVIKRGR